MYDDLTKKSGIYPFVLDDKESHLNIRALSDHNKREAYERPRGICPKCKKKFELDGMEADHSTPWHEAGIPTPRTVRSVQGRQSKEIGI